MLLPLVNRYDRVVLSLGKHTEDEISPIMYATVYLCALHLLLMNSTN